MRFHPSRTRVAHSSDTRGASPPPDSRSSQQQLRLSLSRKVHHFIIPNAQGKMDDGTSSGTPDSFLQMLDMALSDDDAASFQQGDAVMELVMSTLAPPGTELLGSGFAGLAGFPAPWVAQVAVQAPQAAQPHGAPVVGWSPVISAPAGPPEQPARGVQTAAKSRGGGQLVTSLAQRLSHQRSRAKKKSQVGSLSDISPLQPPPAPLAASVSASKPTVKGARASARCRYCP